MKMLLTILVVLGTVVAHADEPCKSLADYRGKYVLVSKTCDGPFGEILSVEAFNSIQAPFIITSGGFGIGPAITPNSSDTCKMTPDVFIVHTCTSNSLCRPQNWIYRFSGNTLIFTANGCEAQFVRE